MRTFTGKEYLKLDIANNFGLDGEDWDVRLSWFKQHESQLEDLVEKADKPALFFAGVEAYRAVQRGEPIGYPVSFDATSSNIQILACLTGDRRAAELCNVVNVGRRMDAYKAIYKAMVERLGEQSLIERKKTKKAIMTAYFNSKQQPEKVFGEGTVLLKTFYDVLEIDTPACWQLTQAFLAMWQEDALEYNWTLPDNFHVKIKVMDMVFDTVHFLNEPYEVSHKANKPKKTGRSLGANTVHSIDGMIVREMTRRCDYDAAWVSLVRDLLNDETVFHFEGEAQKAEAREMTKTLWDNYQKSGYLSARILDYIDSETIDLIERAPLQELIDSLPVKPFKLLTTHDCFRSLPNYMNDVRRQYILQLHLIARSRLLEFVLSQIMGYAVNIEKFDDTMAKDVLESEYALS